MSASSEVFSRIGYRARFLFDVESTSRFDESEVLKGADWKEAPKPPDNSTIYASSRPRTQR